MFNAYNTSIAIIALFSNNALIHPVEITSEKSVYGTRRISLKDIALRAKLDKSTVAKALSGHPKIASKTRALVESLAKEMGYQRDPMLSIIAAHRWKNYKPKCSARVAVVWYGIAPIDWNRSVLNGIESTSLSLGYAVDNFDLASFPHPEKLPKILFARGYEGIIHSQYRGLWMPRMIDWSPFPNVSFLIGNYPSEFDTIRLHASQAVVTAWEEAFNRGYRSPALVVFDETAQADEHLRTGTFLSLQQSIPVKNRIPPLRVPLTEKTANSTLSVKNSTLSEIHRWMLRWKPDCVFGINQLPYWWIKAVSLDIPGDAAYIALSADHSHDMIAGLVANWEGVGIMAMEQLHLKIRASQRGAPALPTQTLVPYEFKDGASLPIKTKEDAPAPIERKQGPIKRKNS